MEEFFNIFYNIFGFKNLIYCLVVGCYLFGVFGFLYCFFFVCRSLFVVEGVDCKVNEDVVKLIRDFYVVKKFIGLGYF